MKKVEAKLIAPERSQLIMEYITQILSDPENVNAKMNFSSYKIDNQLMCTLDIYVPKREFEKHLNLGITSDHSLVLYEQVLNDLLDSFLPHKTIGITKYYSIKSSGRNFSGIDAVNLQGSKININFNSSGQEFMNLITNYTQKYDEFLKKSNEQQSKKR